MSRASHLLLGAVSLGVGVVLGVAVAGRGAPADAAVSELAAAPLRYVPPPLKAAGADGQDTGGPPAVDRSAVILEPYEHDEDGMEQDVPEDVPRFNFPPAPEAPEGETRHWMTRLANGWRKLDGDPERAARQFRRVLNARPRLAEAHVGLGVALIRLSRPQEAVPWLCAATRLDAGGAALAKGPLDAIGARCE